MLRLIAYDIKDARRLRKAARICADYGMRIEYSVFGRRGVPDVARTNSEGA